MAAADSHQLAITLAAGLDMPPSQAATQTFGIIGAKGSGKSYTARRLAEQLHAAPIQTIVLDPIGNWWSLRLAADGVKPGIAIPVFGGMQADVPLELDAGEKLAAALVSTGSSAIVDVSEWSKRHRKEFVADFLEALYRQARVNRKPRMLIVEEAQVFAPQHTQRGEERMLGAITDVVRLGRNYWLGSTLITQRPQSVSKEVLNQVEVLLVGQLRGPHERKAIEGWATETGADDGVSNADLKSLPSLAVGEFFCWSPSWLRLFRRIKVLPTWTYDGSASTPGKGGPDQSIAPAAVDAVDIEELRDLLLKPSKEESDRAEADEVGHRQELLDTIERREARIEELESELQVERDSNALDEVTRQEVERIRHELRRMSDSFAQYAKDLRAMADGSLRGKPDADPVLAIREAMMSEPCKAPGRDGRHEVYRDTLGPDNPTPIHRCRACGAAAPVGPSPVLSAQMSARSAWKTPIESGPGPAKAKPPRTKAIEGDATGYRESLLAVIAQHDDIEAPLIGMLSGKSHRSSTFKAALRSLLNDLLVSSGGGRYKATQAGLRRAKPSPMPTGRALLEFWVSKLPEYEGLILNACARSKASGMDAGAISLSIMRSATSSSFKQALRTLRRFGLLEQTGALWRLTPAFRKAIS